MAGYQGWFNAPGDGANMGWNHYATQGKFEPGACKVDYWPDTKEYQHLYRSPFKLADGSPAYVFSSYDSQTVALHFLWMQQYGVDGVFVQRSVTALRNPANLRHDDRVLSQALAASRRYHRALAIMYDFSGMNDENKDWQVVIDDWKHLVDSLHIAAGGEGQTYLYHHGKPLVGIWGVGFPDRHNDLGVTARIIDFLQHDPVYGGCSILLGVPAYWRDLNRDTEKDPYLHELIRKVDIVRPWFVGRFNEQTYEEFRGRIKEDITWCHKYHVDYAPVIFPGMSWHNMHPESKMPAISRDRGNFYWEQITGAVGEGAEMLYVAMFDEMDEGTAIFKTTNDPPVGGSHFERFEKGIPSDRYLYLTGMAGRLLRGARDTGIVAGGNGNLKKQFNPPGLPMEPFCMARDKVNGYLLAGDYGHPASALNPAKTTALIRIDENGCVIWSKSMILDQEEVIQSIISTSDTGFLVSAFPFQAANANYSNPLSVFKLDKEGNVQWARSYGSGASVSNYLSALYETDDKGFLFEIGSFPDGGHPSYLSVIKTDVQGNVVWGRALSMESDALYRIGGIIEKNGSIYATGSMYATAAPFQLIRSFLTQMDMRTGQTRWTKQNDPAQTALGFTDLHDYRNGLLINSFGGNLLNELLYTDDEGNILGSSRINNPYGSLNGRENILVTPDNGLYFHQYSGTATGTHKEIIMRLDSNQQVSWQYDYSQDSSMTSLNQIDAAPGGGMAATGSGVGANGLTTMSFIKVDTTGALCHSGNSGLSLTPTLRALIPMTWNEDAAISIDAGNLTQSLQPLTMTSHSFCSGGCDSLKLEGPSVFCRLSDTARYILHIDPACPDPINWVYDPANLSILTMSDSGLEVKFKSPGTYTIKAEKNGCSALEDSVIVTAGDPGLPLPADTTLCSGHSLVLDAGAGYNSYVWQDGSTGQSIRVTTAGTYWVKRTGPYCVYTDSILVMADNCSHVIYFPNAFTPNGDGRNDLFRPALSGRPVLYHFSIYNRLGQRIFDTTDPHKGWDGRIGGRVQDAGTYIWSCNYQFAGDKKMSRKGTITLVL